MFKNLVCLIIIWIAAIFDHFLINFQFKLTKQDTFTIVMYQSCMDASAFIVAYIYFTNVGMIQTFFRSFALGLVGIITLLAFLYGYHGSEVYCIGLFLITCKIGISAACANAFIAMVYMFKSRVQGTALGIGIASGSMLAIFSPVVAKYEPIWIPMMIVSFFAFTGMITSLMIQKLPIEYRMDTEYFDEEGLLKDGEYNEYQVSKGQPVLTDGNKSSKGSNNEFSE